MKEFNSSSNSSNYMIAIIHYYFHLNFFLSMLVSIVTILHKRESVLSANKC